MGYGSPSKPEAHKQLINFLDVTFNLNKSTYRSFTNPNTTLQYVHCKSINPPITTKNIPAGTNKRLSSLSSNKAFFDQTAPTYQKALNKCGYQYTLFLRKNRNTDFLYIYIYIYIERERERERERGSLCIDFPVYSARYVELERGICCERGKKQKIPLMSEQSRNRLVGMKV